MDQIATTTATATKLISLKDAQAALGIKRSKLQAMLRYGELRGIHIGRRHLIPETTLHAFVEQRMAGNA